MSTKIKKSSGILEALARFWNEETIENQDLSDFHEVIDKETEKNLILADNNTNKKAKEVEEYIVAGEKIKKDMAKDKIERVINAKTEEAMRKYYEKINEKKYSDDKEIGK